MVFAGQRTLPQGQDCDCQTERAAGQVQDYGLARKFARSKPNRELLGLHEVKAEG